MTENTEPKTPEVFDQESADNLFVMLMAFIEARLEIEITSEPFEDISEYYDSLIESFVCQTKNNEK